MRVNKDSWLIRRPIAHRGLWNDKIVENSITAYENATRHGYPIEIDVYLTTDGKLTCSYGGTISITNPGQTTTRT